MAMHTTYNCGSVGSTPTWTIMNNLSYSYILNKVLKCYTFIFFRAIQKLC